MCAGGRCRGRWASAKRLQAAIFGGTAGVAYGVCYHLACDTLASPNRTAYDQMSDAAAHVTLTLAKRNLAKNPLVDPAAAVGSGATGGGGGLHADDLTE